MFLLCFSLSQQTQTHTSMNSISKLHHFRNESQSFRFIIYAYLLSGLNRKVRRTYTQVVSLHRLVNQTDTPPRHPSMVTTHVSNTNPFFIIVYYSFISVCLCLRVCVCIAVHCPHQTSHAAPSSISYLQKTCSSTIYTK